ncbi:hypothetical protein RHS01_05715 [Rhizoctonia solani]|uniref:Uncharacterized protein n=1 Tax=Rhizoctonia solani TaxID=456999 RepID=A0A8H7ID89_9AGAM|nr:hypothetical protein RHS01_05715 [Rhizoctonia solani]
MSWFGDDSNQAQAYEQVTQRPHEASWSHELIAGAAAFEAAKAYENHAANNGRISLLISLESAGFVGAFVDREVETRGLDAIDRARAKRHAQDQAEEALAQQGIY